jgi:hypothetical protein
MGNKYTLNKKVLSSPKGLFIPITSPREISPKNIFKDCLETLAT